MLTLPSFAELQSAPHNFTYNAAKNCRHALRHWYQWLDEECISNPTPTDMERYANEVLAQKLSRSGVSCAKYTLRKYYRQACPDSPLAVIPASPWMDVLCHAIKAVIVSYADINHVSDFVIANSTLQRLTARHFRSTARERLETPGGQQRIARAATMVGLEKTKFSCGRNTSRRGRKVTSKILAQLRQEVGSHDAV